MPPSVTDGCLGNGCPFSLSCRVPRGADDSRRVLPAVEGTYLIRTGRSGGTTSGAVPGVLGVKSLDREGTIVAAHDQAPLA